MSQESQPTTTAAPTFEPAAATRAVPKTGRLMALDALRGFDTLTVRGLMTLAVQSDQADEVRGCFRALRDLRDRAAEWGHDLPRLSMGMSGDFALAIAEGATEVRIGSAIFGTRSPHASV